jgi:hypothetical protein
MVKQILNFLFLLKIPKNKGRNISLRKSNPSNDTIRMQKIVFLNIRTIILLFSFLSTFWFSPQAQGRSDFFDNYDYSLQNYKGGESLRDDSFQEYKLPRPRKKQTLLEPKNVRREIDSSVIVPPPAGLRRATATSANTLNANNVNSLPVNPFTGDLNVEAILKNQDEKRQKKENVKRAREEREKEIYSESGLRRSEIIFFTTIPFAIGGSAALALFINNFSSGFYKSNLGALFVASSAIGISATNVYLDSLLVKQNELEKKRLTEDILPNNLTPNKIEFTIPFWSARF